MFQLLDTLLQFIKIHHGLSPWFDDLINHCFLLFHDFAYFFSAHFSLTKHVNQLLNLLLSIFLLLQRLLSQLTLHFEERWISINILLQLTKEVYQFKLLSLRFPEFRKELLVKSMVLFFHLFQLLSQICNQVQRSLWVAHQLIELPLLPGEYGLQFFDPLIQLLYVIEVGWFDIQFQLVVILLQFQVLRSQCLQLPS